MWQQYRDYAWNLFTIVKNHFFLSLSETCLLVSSFLSPPEFGNTPSTGMYLIDYCLSMLIFFCLFSYSMTDCSNNDENSISESPVKPR